MYELFYSKSKMHPDHVKIQNQNNKSKMKHTSALDLEVTGEKCNTSKNSHDLYTGICFDIICCRF